MKNSLIRRTMQRVLLMTLLAAVAGCASTGASRSGEVMQDSRVIRGLLIEAVAAQQKADTAEASRLFKQMMALQPRSPEALNSYAIFLREQWRIDEAETTYQQALDYSPGNAMTHWNLAVLYELYLGKPKQAVNHYQAYQKNSTDPDRRVQGWIAQLQQQLEQAQTHTDK